MRWISFNPVLTWKLILTVVGVTTLLTAAYHAIAYWPWLSFQGLTAAFAIRLWWQTRQARAERSELVRFRTTMTEMVADEVNDQMKASLTYIEELKADLRREESARAATNTQWAHDVERLDLSGQFMALCVRWNKARKSKAAPATAGGVVLDEKYWWKKVEEVAGWRWPNYTWQPDELLAAAEEIGEKPDVIRWRQVVNSKFGLTLQV